MSTETAATVDSLIKFNYKKKFSFSNKRLSNDVNSNDESLSEDDSKSKKVLSNKNNHQPKGSAVLKTKKKKKSSSSSASFSSESDSDASISSKKKKKSKTNKKKVKSDDSEDEEVEKRERHLKKLFSMFPHHSIELIEKVWLENNYDSKKCIDILLTEKENNAKDSNRSLEIDEWSDGDENIRNRNLENKKKRESNSSSNSSSSLANGTAAHEKKRKSENNELKEPLKKKARKVIVESDESDSVEANENDDEVNSKKNYNKSSSSSTLTSSPEKIMKPKTKKKAYVKFSSDEEQTGENSNSSDKFKSDDSNSSKATKKKEKKEEKKDKKKKKKSRKDSESDGEGDDNEFNRSDADNDSDDSNVDELTDSEKAAILSLFNSASIEEIQSMLSLSANRVRLVKSVLEQKPFQDFIELQKKLAEKSLVTVIESVKDIIYARSIVTDLLSKCETISQKMEKQVASLIEYNDNPSNVDSKSSTLEIKRQPKNLNKALSLKPYQLIGLNWLCLMHKENINGILADEMGLGKTCQTIAFLAHLLEVSPKSTHLIIVPPSTLDNWIREISAWCPDFYFTVYQGSLEERKHLRFDILNNKFEKPLNGILTTYGLLSSTNEDKAFFRKLKLDYCVYDEAHMLKNMNSIRYQSLIKIKSKKRLLLTGTPIQNNLVELMSLLYFVMPDIFSHKTEYVNKIFSGKPSDVDKNTYYNDKINQAKGIMKPFILRRLKSDVLKQLPKKIEEVLVSDMTQRQTKEYNNLISYYKKRKDQLLLENEEKALEEKKAKEAKKAPSKIDEVYEIMDANKPKAKPKAETNSNEMAPANIIMELRKAANHPLLRRCIYDNDKLKQMAKLIMKESSPDTVFEYVVEDMSVMSDFQLHKLCPLYKCLKGFELDDSTILDSGKFVVLNSLLEEKKEMGDRVLIFSQFVIMLDILEEFLKIKKYKYCRLDGTTAVNERQDLIDEYNNDNEIFVFLLSTRAGGMGINLTAANVVILHDIDYNPFNDKQAEDRCHRVGQTKEVQVYKLISKDSIDETMLKIQRAKLELGADISGQNDAEVHHKTDMISMLKEALNL